MYVRIAKFENADSNWDERIAQTLARIKTRGSGTAMEPAGTGVNRAMMLVDRANNRSASALFCETEEAARAVDEAMDQMPPPPGGGTRTSAEIYEIAIDFSDW